jgi:hypothetical protein
MSLTNIKKITAIGSCRLDGLYERFIINDVKNSITFTHSTKEVLQLIAHLNSIRNFSDKDEIKKSKWLFRTYLIKPKTLLKIQKIQKIAKIFFESDLYVIEISSKKIYERDGKYFHEIIKNPLYGYPGIEKILERKLSTNELSDDLDLIVKSLPGRVMIVSHILTRADGPRHDLVMTLERLCREKGVPFFSPGEALKDYQNKNLYLERDDIAHYTPYGRLIIGRKYREYIKRNFDISMPRSFELSILIYWRLRACLALIFTKMRFGF